MKLKSIGLLQEILITQMNHWAFYPLYLGGIVLLGEFVSVNPPHLLLWAVMGIFPLYLYWVRTHIRSFVPFFFCHLFVPIFAVLLPGEQLSIHIFHCLFGIGYMVISFSIRGRQKGVADQAVTPALIVILAFISLFYQNYLGYSQWNHYPVITVLLSLGLYYVVTYLDHYFRFLQVNDSSAGQIPAGLIFRSGFKMTFVYTLLTMAVSLLLSHIQWLGHILQGFRNGITLFLYYFFSLFPKDTGEEVLETIAASTEEIVEEVPLETMGDTFIGWQVLEYLVEILFLLGVLWVAYRGIRHLIVWVKTNHFFKIRKSFQDTEAETNDVHENCEITHRKRTQKKISFFWKQSFEKQIRHLYQAYVKSHEGEFIKENGNLFSATARETVSALGKEEDLAVIYEKARYSKKPCSKEDVKHMREICNSHHNAL